MQRWPIKPQMWRPEVEWANPLTRGLDVLLPFNDELSFGAGARYHPNIVTSVVASPYWAVSAPDFNFYYGLNQSTAGRTVTFGNNGSGSPGLLAYYSAPLMSFTALCVIQRLTSGLPTTALFGQRVSSDENLTHRCGTHFPWSDGIIYWDFGDILGDGRVTASGNVPTPFRPERWAFRAGTQGMAIFREGSKIASSTNPTSRPSAGSFGEFYTQRANGEGLGYGDDMNWYLFATYHRELPDDEILAWTRDPYQLFRRPRVRTYGLPTLITLETVRPDGTVDAGSWTPVGAASLHAAVSDEDDATLMRSSSGAGTDPAELSFTDPGTPSAGPITFYIRHRRTP